MPLRERPGPRADHHEICLACPDKLPIQSDDTPHPRNQHGPRAQARHPPCLALPLSCPAWLASTTSTSPPRGHRHQPPQPRFRWAAIRALALASRGVLEIRRHGVHRSPTGACQPHPQCRTGRMARGGQAVPLPARAGHEGAMRESQGDPDGRFVVPAWYSLSVRASSGSAR